MLILVQVWYFLPKKSIYSPGAKKPHMGAHVLQNLYVCSYVHLYVLPNLYVRSYVLPHSYGCLYVRLYVLPFSKNFILLSNSFTD